MRIPLTLSQGWLPIAAGAAPFIGWRNTVTGPPRGLVGEGSQSTCSRFGTVTRSPEMLSARVGYKPRHAIFSGMREPIEGCPSTLSRGWLRSFHP